jgi:asparagine synthetase B (glutamine-hydrolysing)
VVSRTSPEGKMMSKWLIAARKKLGGRFPRDDAKKEVDRYAKKMKQLKAKKMNKITKDRRSGEI